VLRLVDPAPTRPLSFVRLTLPSVVESRMRGVVKEMRSPSCSRHSSTTPDVFLWLGLGEEALSSP
jgi:hypothetical protein